jgi:hypothetical protein
MKGRRADKVKRRTNIAGYCLTGEGLEESAGGAAEGGVFRKTRLGKKNPGGDLLSQILADQVPWALASLTAVFGMGTGVSSPVMPPGKLEVSIEPPTAPRSPRTI